MTTFLFFSLTARTQCLSMLAKAGIQAVLTNDKNCSYDPLIFENKLEISWMPASLPLN